MNKDKEIIKEIKVTLYADGSGRLSATGNGASEEQLARAAAVIGISRDRLKDKEASSLIKEGDLFIDEDLGWPVIG